MGQFARIIELKNKEQVLLTLNYLSKGDNYELVLRTDTKTLDVKAKLEFNSEKKAIHMLKNFTDDDAIKFRENILKDFTNQKNEES